MDRSMRMNLFLPTQQALARHFAASPLAVPAGLKIGASARLEPQAGETPFPESRQSRIKARRYLSPKKSLPKKSRS